MCTVALINSSHTVIAIKSCWKYVKWSPLNGGVLKWWYPQIKQVLKRWYPQIKQILMGLSSINHPNIWATSNKTPDVQGGWIWGRYPLDSWNPWQILNAIKSHQLQMTCDKSRQDRVTLEVFEACTVMFGNISGEVSAVSVCFQYSYWYFGCSKTTKYQ